LFGFMLGIWATSWEKLTIVPSLVITPLAFLGGSFYSLDVLPPLWRTVTLFNPVVYLVSTFRWCFHGKADVNLLGSILFIAAFVALCLAITTWMIRSGWRLRS